MRHLLPLLTWAAFAPAAIALPPGFYDRPLVSGLSGPTCFAFAPDGRIFVGQKTGAIRIVKNNQLLVTPFMNVPCTSNSERGVLGLALDPNFATNRYVYIYYTTSAASLNPPPTPKNRVSRFVANGDVVTPASEEILLDLIPSDAGNHNAGGIRFGIDGKLWIATGDGGQTPALSQNLNTLAGKLLRINPDGSIPNDNPFFGMANHRSEIWAYGFRNPFRFSFRPGTSVPYVGDVGGTQWEEINVGAIGANFGWPNAEGMSSNPAYRNPIFAYPHSGQSKSISGGVFAGSPRFPASWASRYLFADYVQDDFYYLDVNSNNQLLQQGSLGDINGPVDFAIGTGGWLYYVAIKVGQIRKITYEPRPKHLTIASRLTGGLTATGYFQLDLPAPAGGLPVSLSSDNPILTVPATSTVLSDSTSGGFTYSTNPVLNETPVIVTISSFGKSVSRTIIIDPNLVKQIVGPSTMAGPQQATFYVGLNARSTGVTTVDLASSDPALAVPGAVQIQNGQSSAGFTAIAAEVSSTTNATLTASLNAASKTKSITVVAPDLLSISATPNPIVGGQTGVGTITLRNPAPAGGISIPVFDNSSLIGTPPRVVVLGGDTTADFNFQTVDVTVDTTRTISARLQGVTRTVVVTILRD